MKLQLSGIIGMNKLFFFILLLSFSLFSQSGTVLYLHPNGPRYKKVEMGIKSELSNSLKIVSLISKNEAEIKSSIDNITPKIVIVSSMDMIKTWKKLQSKYTELNQISSILLDSEFSENDMGGFANSCVINSDIKLGQYIECASQQTGKKPQNIGVVYSSKSVKDAQAYQQEAAKLNVNVYDKQIIASDPEASIKSSVKNLTDIFKVEFIIILDDPVTINNQNINSAWASLLSGLKIPVAVPADYFYEIEPKIGSLAIQQHYSAIGGVIASLINRAETNNWYISQKYVYTDKSIFYFRNKDGSISKENYVQNDIIAYHHPKKEVISVLPEPSVETQPQLTSNKNEIASDKQSNISHAESIIVPEEKRVLDTREIAFEPVIPTQSSEITKSTVPNEKNDQNKRNKEKATVVKEVQQSVSDNAAGTSSNENTDIVFSPSNPASDQSSAITPPTETNSDSMQLPPQKQSDQSHNWLLLSLLILSILIILAVVGYVLLKKRSDKDKNRCLLITDARKQIKYSDSTGKSTTLLSYFKKCGFKVIVSKHIDQINDHLVFNLPEIICIDWQMELDIQTKFYKVLKEQMYYSEFILVFYNVPDSAKTSIGYYEDRTFYLSADFAVSDIKKIISIVQKRSKVLKQSDNQVNPQLEGKIVGDSLSEIFQMMDINKKTGCLIVETDHPAGTVFFEDGIITYAISNTQIAEHAVFDVLALKSGSFHFIPEKRPLSRHMQASVVALLMEQAQCSDESSEFDLLK